MTNLNNKTLVFMVSTYLFYLGIVRLILLLFVRQLPPLQFNGYPHFDLENNSVDQPLKISASSGSQEAECLQDFYFFFYKTAIWNMLLGHCVWQLIAVFCLARGLKTETSIYFMPFFVHLICEFVLLFLISFFATKYINNIFFSAYQMKPVVRVIRFATGILMLLVFVKTSFEYCRTLKYPIEIEYNGIKEKQFMNKAADMTATDAKTEPKVDPTPNLTAIQQRRLQDREEWEAFWKVQKMDAEGKFFPTARYYVQRFFDWPATFFREKIVEPMNDKYRLPYYQRKLTRVPDIDQCGVMDRACQYEAQEQYRLDKLVDTYIVNILKERIDRCINYHTPYIKPCGPVVEDYEEAELNWFIKYGELGHEANAIDVLMKQKHRMIWERRHPEIMEERNKKLEEHKQKLREGDYDHSFWKKGLPWMDKKNYVPPYDLNYDKPPWEGDQPLSKDWQYYKKLKEDPDFDKEQGRKSGVRFL